MTKPGVRERKRRQRRRKLVPAANGAPYVVTCTVMIDAPTLAAARRALSRAIADAPGFLKGEFAPWAARALRGR